MNNLFISLILICATTRTSAIEPSTPSKHIPPRSDEVARSAGPPIPRYNEKEMTAQRFNSHLSSGLPFVVNLPNPLNSELPHSLDEWAEEMAKHSKLEPVMWNNRLSPEQKEDYDAWVKAGNNISFNSFKWGRSRWPKSYLSIVANDKADKEFLNEQYYPTPSFISEEQTGETGMWMYAGGKGAGVPEHIDSIGCVCSWSYMLFGSKKWWIGSPFHSFPLVLYQPLVQEKGDFFFWCVGWKHETEILSDESLDVHGYTALNKTATEPNLAEEYSPDLLFSEKLSHYASNCLSKPSENKETCEVYTELGNYCYGMEHGINDYRDRKHVNLERQISRKEFIDKLVRFDQALTAAGEKYKRFEFYFYGFIHIPGLIFYILFYHIFNFIWLIYVPLFCCLMGLEYRKYIKMMKRSKIRAEKQKSKKLS